MSKATGVSRQVIRQGIGELKGSAPAPRARIRRPGGGRKRAVERDPSLPGDLEKLVEPVTRGDPESPLRWTCKGVRKLADELRQMGHAVSHPIVAELLHELGYSLQANRKTQEGASHPDRNAQFEYINRKVKRYLARRGSAEFRFAETMRFVLRESRRLRRTRSLRYLALRVRFRRVTVPGFVGRR